MEPARTTLFDLARRFGDRLPRNAPRLDRPDAARSPVTADQARPTLRLLTLRSA